MSNFTDPISQKKQEPFPFRTFRENLGKRMDSNKLHALKVLGDDFFYLVDSLSSDLFVQFRTCAPLLEMSETEYHWELQVFVNQFLRHCSESSDQLIPFCRQLRRNLGVNDFSREFHRMLGQAYQDHFYTSEGQNNLLV